MGRPPDGKDRQPEGLVPRPAGARAGRLLGGHPADDRGQLFGAGHLRQQRVLLGRASNGSTRCSTPTGSGTRSGASSLFSAIILAIEMPLGIVIALNMPKKGFWASVCLVLMALPLLIPWNVVGTIWQIFGRVDIGLLGHTLAGLGHRLQLHQRSLRRLGHHHRDGRLALDLARRAAVLCRPAIDPGGLLPGGRDRPGHRAGRCSATSSCPRCRACC